MDQHNPETLHISRVGPSNGEGLRFRDGQDDKGDKQEGEEKICVARTVGINKLALSRLLGGFDGLQLVIMSTPTCDRDAQMMADKVCHCLVVGQGGQAQDVDAVEFAKVFYRVLGDSAELVQAVKQGRDAVKKQNRNFDILWQGTWTLDVLLCPSA